MTTQAKHEPTPAPGENSPADMGDAGDEELGALHCLGMCMDWEGHPAYQNEADAGLRQFLIDCAEGLRWQRDEIERLRQALAEIAFRPDVVPYNPGAMVDHAEDALSGKR